MIGRLLVGFVFLCLIEPALASFDTVSEAAANEKGCQSCHEGIEKFSEGPMMIAIQAMASVYGDPGGCVICHGGTPGAISKTAAHAGAPAVLAASGGRPCFIRTRAASGSPTKPVVNAIRDIPTA